MNELLSNWLLLTPKSSWTHQHVLASWFKTRHEQQNEPDYLKNKPFSKSSNYFWNACKLLEKKLNVQSSFPEVLLKTLCRSLFFNRPATFLKKGLQLSGLRLQLLSVRIICQEHFKVNMGRMRAKIFWLLTSSF